MEENHEKILALGLAVLLGGSECAMSGCDGFYRDYKRRFVRDGQSGIYGGILKNFTQSGRKFI